jgi:hypothetical protein
VFDTLANESYRCTVALTSTTNPSLQLANWAVIARKGADGAAGATGPAGASGATGPNYPVTISTSAPSGSGVTGQLWARYI